MAELLQSKLHVPAPRRTVLTRSRLHDRIDAAGDAGLVLVSAPAGFGKTTLLIDWASSSPSLRRSTAWVSLDQRDNDPASFWAYVLAALQTVVPAVGDAAAASLLASPHDPYVGLERLLNDLQAAQQDVHLVLDDYHVIESRGVHDGLAFLLDHLPPRVHVLLATRADPPLQLPRLRARGQLLEVRVADLRFTPDEATAYLREGMGLALTEQDVLALDSRTEGWVAALQLAALSMQGRHDLSGFIAGFTGDDRYVVDYLAEEVLQRLPADTRQFLLHTCVLSRFDGSLCDAVTLQDGGRATLELLDRRNLFVVALDDRRRWYRYHHLFADVLRARLHDEQPEVVPVLHRRASEWHEAHGDLAEAVQHAVAGAHWEHAADLVERTVPALRRTRQEATLRRWVEALPEQLVRSRPVLSISYAGSLMSIGQLEGVEPHLQDVERWLAANPGAATAPAADPLLRTLPGTVAMYRAGQARVRGDVAGTIRHAHRALELAGEDDHLERGAAAALLGLAHWSRGELGTAVERYTESVEAMLRAGHVADLLGCTIALADMQLARGRLTDAMAAHRRALAAALREPVPPRGTADAHTGVATLLLEQGAVAAAVGHLQASAALGEGAALPQNAYRWRLAMATVRELDGDVPGALELLDEAERDYDTDYSPDVRPVAAVRARLELRHGRTTAALAWSRARGLSADDEPTFLREYEHLTLARVLLAAPAGTEASSGPLDRFLRRLLDEAERGGRGGSVLDVLLLQARAAARQRQDAATALRHVRQALELAEPQGWVRSVLDHGPVVVELLRALARQPAASPYARHLLEQLGDRPPVVPAQSTGPERLSEREVEVLRLLTSDLDGPGIARTLVVSVNTVRTHTKSIYAKLGVTSRRAAVSRGHDLGLLPRGPRG